MSFQQALICISNYGVKGIPLTPKISLIFNSIHMSIKAILAKPFSKFITASVNRWASRPKETQDKVFKDLIRKAKNTMFGNGAPTRLMRPQPTIRVIPLKVSDTMLPKMLCLSKKSHKLEGPCQQKFIFWTLG